MSAYTAPLMPGMSPSGPPDVSHLPREQRLEVLREYRRKQEQKRDYDFAAGPPDISGLEGSERLAVLREYRHYLQTREQTQIAAMTPAAPPAGVAKTKSDDAPTPRAIKWMGGPAPYAYMTADGAPAAVDISDDAPVDESSMAAGVASGAHGSVYTYFERERTDQERRPNAPTRHESVVPEEEADAVQKAMERVAIEAQARAEALEGAAGRDSRAMATAWEGSWLESDGTPRHCRKLIPKENNFEATTARIFAPDKAPDEGVAEATKAKAKELLELRQKMAEEELLMRANEVEVEPTAGVRTVIDPSVETGAAAATGVEGAVEAAVEPPVVPPTVDATEMQRSHMSLAMPSTPRMGDSGVPDGAMWMPETAGMSRRAALEAKRVWRMQLLGMPVPGGATEMAPPATPSGLAGMPSEARSRTVRGHVGPLDPESAADYNLQVKLAKGGMSERIAATPYALGAEKENDTMTHAERLQQMRALRQAAGGMTPR